MPTVLVDVLAYLFAAAGLAILISCDPKRLAAGKQPSVASGAFGLPRWFYFSLVLLPFALGVLRGNAADALIALGVLFVAGWLLTRAYAVRRGSLKVKT